MWRNFPIWATFLQFGKQIEVCLLFGKILGNFKLNFYQIIWSHCSDTLQINRATGMSGSSLPLKFRDIADLVDPPVLMSAVPSIQIGTKNAAIDPIGNCIETCIAFCQEHAIQVHWRDMWPQFSTC